jgi:hypothetical protein
VPQPPCKTQEPASEAYCGREEQVVRSLDTSMVLLQSCSALEPKSQTGKRHLCFAFLHDRAQFCDEGIIQVP